jgi:hypothetical protein
MYNYWNLTGIFFTSIGIGLEKTYESWKWTGKNLQVLEMDWEN